MNWHSSAVNVDPDDPVLIGLGAVAVFVLSVFLVDSWRWWRGRKGHR